MGVYLCIAKSSVPPIMSKRFSVRVNCKPALWRNWNFCGDHQNTYLILKVFFYCVSVKPQVQVENHYVGAPIGKDVRLHCKIEASPRPTFQWINNKSKGMEQSWKNAMYRSFRIVMPAFESRERWWHPCKCKSEGCNLQRFHFWLKSSADFVISDEPIMPNPKVHITETIINEFTTEMNLIIRFLERRDFGEYTCVSENTIGRVEGKIRLKGNVQCRQTNIERSNRNYFHFIRQNYYCPKRQRAHP